MVAAPLNVFEGDLAMPAKIAQSGRAFLALRPLEVAFGPHVAHLVEASPPPVEPTKPVPLISALNELGRLEEEYRRTIAVHLRGTSDDLDPNELLRWSDELAKADRVLDEPLEVDAFIAQSVTPALSAQWGALGALGGELAPLVESLRERYLETLGIALKSLARKVIGRQAALSKMFADAISGGNTKQLAERALGGALTSGVSAALVMTRVSSQLAALAGFTLIDAASIDAARRIALPATP